MIDTSETSHLGSCPRRDRESEVVRWPDQEGLENTDSTSDRNPTEGDTYSEYGSICRQNKRCQFSNTIDSSIDYREYWDGVDRGGNITPLEHLRRRTFNTTCMAYLSLLALCLTSFGIASFYNIEGIASLFIFDNLYFWMTKSSSQTTVDLSPSISRSILLVLQAEVTPINPIVKDIDRQLTANGMSDAVGLGVYLKKHDIAVPEWIFASPTERTAYTTELIRQNWASEVDVAFEEVLYVLEFNDYFTFVEGLNDHFRRIMIVGHNPAILNTAKILMKTHGIEDFPYCGLLEIQWDDLKEWKDVQPNSGSSRLAIDPNNNFFFSSPDEQQWRG